MNQSLQIFIKRFDKTLPMPEYQTSGSAAFDLYAREETVIEPQQVKLVPLNVAVQMPKDHFAILAARSSLHKSGVNLVNGIGVGDYDYRGDGDEYRAALFNFSDKKVVIEKGQRIVQMIILKRDIMQIIEKESFDSKNRGGFGSTG